MNSISLDAVAALTGIGRSTLWRKLADGALAKGEKDARGRATVALADVLGLIGEGTRVAFSDADLAVLLQADAGDAQAQADIGALLQVHGGAKPRCTGCRRPPSRAAPRPCSGWARPMRPRALSKATNWR
ncbi:hypothetical protein ACFSTJ_07970 [Ottowia pentelensis]|uniref:hypothetical protein n=1 Tax=Ottowia pentelensis TaxID=511108 RepID=UPI00362A71D5